MQIIISLNTGTQVPVASLRYIIEAGEVFFDAGSVGKLANASPAELTAIAQLLVSTPEATLGTSQLIAPPVVAPVAAPVQDVIPGLEATPTPSFLDAANRGLSGA